MVAALLSELGGAFETNGNIEEAERMYTTAVALVRQRQHDRPLTTAAREIKHPALHRVDSEFA